MATADEVLDFWFGEPAGDPVELERRFGRWYQGGPAMDDAIRARFADATEQALRGELDGWAASTRGRIALILLLDQFTRALFRGTPRAFAGDEHAERLTVEALDAGADRDLSIVERLFLLMPLLHAESAELQARASVELARIHGDAPDDVKHLYAMAVEQSNKYSAVIGRFGRFPHRNEALGRVSTPEELEFLEDWAREQPPARMRKS